MKTQPALRRITIILLFSLAVLSILSLARFNQSLWLDEGTSVWFARLPVKTLVSSLCDPHPAGYYLFLKSWLLAGDGEEWLRLPSLLASLFAIALTYRIGVERCGRTCAALAAILLALQPLQSWYASEVRMYTLAQALGLLAVWLGWRIIGRPAGRAGSKAIVLAYILVTTLALWFDFTALLVWGLLQLIWISYGRPKAWRWIGVQVPILLLAGLGLTSNQLVTISNNIYPVFLAIRARNLGIPLTPAAASTLLQLAAAGGAVLCLALAIHWHRRRFMGSALAQWTVVGVWVALLALAVLPVAFTLKRRLVVVLPYVALATAYASIQRPRIVTNTLVALSALAAVIAVFILQREPWRMVIQDLQATKPAASTVVWVDEMAVPAFDYYWRRAEPASEFPPWTPLFGRALPATPRLTPEAGGTLWIIVAESSYRHLTRLLPVDFLAEYQPVTERHETGIGIYRYQRRLQPAASATPLPDRTPADEWGLLPLSPLDTCNR